MDFNKYYELLSKGGAGSGKKGHKTQKDLEQLKGQMGSAHIMQHGDKGSAFSTAHSQGKAEVFHHQPTDSYHVVTDGKGAKQLKDHPDFHGLGAPSKSDPAAAGNKASREDASGTRKDDADEAHDIMSSMVPPKSDPAAEGNLASRQDASGTRPDIKKKDENMKKAGEGSRGGKVVGHTKSGKPIYQGARDSKHKAFDKRDHLDSANHKYKLAEEYSKKLQDAIKKDPSIEGEKANKVRTFIKDTHEQAGHHQRIANSKGDHEESRMNTGGSLPASAVAPKNAKALAAIKELRAKGQNEQAKQIYDTHIRDN